MTWSDYGPVDPDFTVFNPCLICTFPIGGIVHGFNYHSSVVMETCQHTFLFIIHFHLNFARKLGAWNKGVMHCALIIQID